MSIIDVNIIKENDIVKFITPDKTLVDGKIKKISNDFLGIIIDTRQDTFIVLHKDKPIELILIQKHQALKCTATILGCTQNDFEQVVIISIPELVLSIERRKFERLPIVMDIEYSLLPDELHCQTMNTINPKYFRSFKKTYTVNISAGGVYFIISKKEIDAKCALVSLLIKNEKIIALCEKLRTDHDDDDPKHYKVAYKFNDISAQHRQLILDFVTEKSKENNISS
ncbi:PilZ domain-containing protein [Clostridium sp. BL-8]|uniref:PilZ domain-containing protein n=1 Tax=Clostridium sp. BL-8 TaxID=349938 RepID=UPI00098CAEB7|nr:PilZ domain-containing protein [Clostridium sp. BL-8]OOM76759.1 PilZ domain protein [Clostridium sp. BL-8]